MKAETAIALLDLVMKDYCSNPEVPEVFYHQLRAIKAEIRDYHRPDFDPQNPPDYTDAEKLMIAEGRQISVIKSYNERTGCGVSISKRKLDAYLSQGVY